LTYERLTQTAHVSEAEPRYSPSGALLAYVRGTERAFVNELVVSRGDGTCARVLAGGRDRSFSSPSWRPGVAQDESLDRC
jgi:hypothetical protein